ncbi:metallophosphoesterase [Sphingomonas sp. M1-B02]|uniref:metallophosphoesterase n=1 Tax=Sphingomonas sp. M1-B02 TaxID=3114300 RepID=UPI00223FB011|nr:metallophosphoesterase [Sphingomonas sp. S6-11]UZK65498.1 metallophosphoesterase [Sphingomonas sp. S6-11]
MLRWLTLVSLILLALAGWGYANILRDPVMRAARIGMADWPIDAAALQVALIGDVHVQGPDMPPERVKRLVAQVNAAQPDLILLAGDFVGDRLLATRAYPDAEIAEALRGLSAPLGTWAVLGNHDHWRNGPSMAAALETIGIRVLSNRAVRAGAVTLVGADDIHTGHADPSAIERAAAKLPGPAILLSHSPDLVPRLSPRFALVLAGHTHCGQIVLPLLGAVASASNYGDRYRCGVIREGSRTVVVGSGLGASILPLRYGAVPDWWLLTLGPAG